MERYWNEAIIIVYYNYNSSFNREFLSIYLTRTRLGRVRVFYVIIDPSMETHEWRQRRSGSARLRKQTHDGVA